MEISNEDKKIIKTVYKALDDKFAFDINILDVREASSIADYFIIASCNNVNQVKAAAESVDEELHKIGVELKQKEGQISNNWLLLDFSIVVVHVFNKEDREFYTLDNVWQNSPTIDIDAL